MDRQEARKEFSFNAEWNGRWYATKQVRRVFVDEPNEIVVVTVYTSKRQGAQMKISYDPEVDALSIVFRDVTVTTKHLAEGIAADYESEGRLAGLEILDVVHRFGGRETLRQVVLEGVGLSGQGGLGGDLDSCAFASRAFAEDIRGGSADVVIERSGQAEVSGELVREVWG